MTITVKNEMDFNDIMNNVWSGAIDTVKTIYDNDKEEEFMNYLSMVFDCGMPTMTELNDFLWFESDEIFNELGIGGDGDDDLDF